MANAAKHDLRQFNINCRLFTTANHDCAADWHVYGQSSDWNTRNAELSYLRLHIEPEYGDNIRLGVQVSSKSQWKSVLYHTSRTTDFNMFWNTLAAGTILAQSAAAQNMLRFGCSQLTVERADPLVNPGMRPSPHTHQIIGGNSFNLTVRQPALPCTLVH
jgi:hypothetical protein